MNYAYEAHLKVILATFHREVRGLGEAVNSCFSVIGGLPENQVYQPAPN